MKSSDFVLDHFKLFLLCSQAKGQLALHSDTMTHLHKHTHAPFLPPIFSVVPRAVSSSAVLAEFVALIICYIWSSPPPTRIEESECVCIPHNLHVSLSSVQACAEQPRVT